MTTERCGDCWHWNAKERECWKDPPTPVPLPAVESFTGEPRLKVIGLRPPCGEGCYCSGFRAKETM